MQNCIPLLSQIIHDGCFDFDYDYLFGLKAKWTIHSIYYKVDDDVI